MYANAKPASIAWGLAFDQNQNGNQAAHCVLALMAITGNIDVPGGQIVAEIRASDSDEDVEATEACRRRLEKVDVIDRRQGRRQLRRGRRTPHVAAVGWDSASPEDLTRQDHRLQGIPAVRATTSATPRPT